MRKVRKLSMFPSYSRFFSDDKVFKVFIIFKVFSDNEVFKVSIVFKVFSDDKVFIIFKDFSNGMVFKVPSYSRFSQMTRNISSITSHIPQPTTLLWDSSVTSVR